MTAAIDWGHWRFSCEEPAEVPFGFIYRVEDKATGMRYLGRKQCLGTYLKKAKKGKVRRLRGLRDLGWRHYTGSCDHLNEEIERFGANNFYFDIVQLCANKWDLQWDEMSWIKEADALRDPMYYNGELRVRLTRKGNQESC